VGFKSGPWALTIGPSKAFLGVDYDQVLSIVADTPLRM